MVVIMGKAKLCFKHNFFLLIFDIFVMKRKDANIKYRKIRREILMNFTKNVNLWRNSNEFMHKFLAPLRAMLEEVKIYCKHFILKRECY